MNSEEMRDYVSDAIELAAKKHRGQLRKDGKTPYILHPMAVAENLFSAGIYDEDIICAALLHDVIEDTDCTLDDIEQLFNKKVAHYLDRLTKRRDEKDYVKRKEKYMKQIMESEYEVKLIKLSDVLHNSESFENLSEERRNKNIEYIKKYYLPMAEELCPEIYKRLLDNLKKYE